MKPRFVTPVGAALAVAFLAAPAGVVNAQSTTTSAPEAWKFRAILYGYFPDMGGTTTFPEGAHGGSGGGATVDASTILDNLQSAFMGTFEARKGRFGILADVLYMDVHGAKTQIRDIPVGGHDLPVGVTANADLALKGTVFELAGLYSLVATPALQVDLVGGARMLDLKQTLTLELSASLGPDTGPGRSRTSTVHPTNWDAVVGAKGQFHFGDRQQWFVPWYADVGGGDSKLTYQLIGGAGYAFSWGQVIAAWRYLDYDFKSGSNVESLDFSGPMVGVAFTW